MSPASSPRQQITLVGASVLPEKWRISKRLLTDLRWFPVRFEDYE
jgi:hypothetical protein